MKDKKKKSKAVSYNKWGYIFLIPFVLVYGLFSLYPLISTFVYSFFQYFRTQTFIMYGPDWTGLDNYIEIFEDGVLLNSMKNTLILWVMGFIPQILFSLLLAAWFSDVRLRLKCAGFFKSVIYLPNLIMAAAFAMMFYMFFADKGPVNMMLMNMGILDKPFKFLDEPWATRIIIAFMNFMMWFGNTTILLMAGMMGIDTSLYEASEVDGATSTQVFFKITLPLLKPILVYVLITSLIGGLQMFDVPQVLTNGSGNPAVAGRPVARTMVMYLNMALQSKNYGLGGAISVLMFIVTGILSFIAFKVTNEKEVM